MTAAISDIKTGRKQAFDSGYALAQAIMIPERAKRVEGHSLVEGLPKK